MHACPCISSRSHSALHCTQSRCKNRCARIGLCILTGNGCYERGNSRDCCQNCCRPDKHGFQGHPRAPMLGGRVDRQKMSRLQPGAISCQWSSYKHRSGQSHILGNSLQYTDPEPPLHKNIPLIHSSPKCSPPWMWNTSNFPQHQCIDHPHWHKQRDWPGNARHSFLHGTELFGCSDHLIPHLVENSHQSE